MEKFTQWLTSKFQQPLSLLFFLVGVVLLVLGVSTGIEVPLLKQIAPDGNYRWVAISAGAVFVIVAILIYYFPPKSKDEPKGIQPIPGELTRSFAARIAGVSGKQKDILAFIARENFQGSAVSQDAIVREVQLPETETYYRLEQLRLLGFIETQRLDADRLAYRLSSAYRDEVGDAGSRYVRHRRHQ